MTLVWLGTGTVQQKNFIAQQKLTCRKSGMLFHSKNNAGSVKLQTTDMNWGKSIKHDARLSYFKHFVCCKK